MKRWVQAAILAAALMASPHTSPAITYGVEDNDEPIGQHLTAVLNC